ncbi:gluconolactonase [Folsomia candida]|uniref:Gluconolactonase n=1 Tax=Folsomia candida TaxID=158441 RepID=A0A226D267_FOLCA|nr:gluconolactonase [Folsomia candida]OXA38366.1 Gluconolactonase [Folsomia candida]
MDTNIIQFFLLFLANFDHVLTHGCHLVTSNKPISCMDLHATPFITSATSTFGRFIEGTSTNRRGHMFAVNYGNSSTLNTYGQFFPQIRPFYLDPRTNSQLHGMRFLNDKTALVIDSANHRVLKLSLTENQNDFPIVLNSTVFCAPTKPEAMMEPNDLTLSRSGTVFTSGMMFTTFPHNREGDVWSCLKNGEAKRLELIGRTNGIDLSFDETRLYISEGTPSGQQIWVYEVDVKTGTVSGKRPFAFFEYPADSAQSIVIDGMRTDVHENLWVTRYGGGEVVVFNQHGKLTGRVRVSFPNPTNMEFGGENGTTLFIVGQCEGADAGCVDSLQVATPGRSWTNLQ